MVAEGGVFSPKIARGPDLADWRSAGASFNTSLELGVGVVCLSGGLDRSSALAWRPYDMKLVRDVGRSGERSGDRLLSR
jgi:hypothetical protein